MNRTPVLLCNFGEDARFSLRQFRRAPGYAAFTVLVLVLGIGTVTAMFTISYRGTDYQHVCDAVDETRWQCHGTSRDSRADGCVERAHPQRSILYRWRHRREFASDGCEPDVCEPISGRRMHLASRFATVMFRGVPPLWALSKTCIRTAWPKRASQNSICACHKLPRTSRFTGATGPVHAGCSAYGNCARYPDLRVTAGNSEGQSASGNRGMQHDGRGGRGFDSLAEIGSPSHRCVRGISAADNRGGAVRAAKLSGDAENAGHWNPNGTGCRPWTRCEHDTEAELIWLGAGTVMGVCLAMVSGRLLNGLLFGVRAIDPWTMGFVSACLVVCGLIAAIVPARRAASVNPVDALRAE